MKGVPAPGTLIDDKYLVEGLLGEGGMSVVLRAQHVARDAAVAIKLVRPEHAQVDEVAKRFRQEAVAASRLRTDHAVQVFDIGQLPNGAPYLVMELLEGEDLDQILLREGTLEIPRAIHIVLQILRALAVAHDAGVVHRDLKPGNVHLSERDGEPEYVKLLDFGISSIAAVEDVRLTVGHALMGTPLYMSPEQAQDARNAGPASDLFSVGALLFETLAGSAPIHEQAIAPLLLRLQSEIPARLDELRPGTPAALADAVARALEKQPQARFSNAREMALALAPFADERSQRVLASLQVDDPASRRSRAAIARSSDLPVLTLTKHSVLKPRYNLVGVGAVTLVAVGGFLLMRTVSPGSKGTKAAQGLQDQSARSAQTLTEESRPMPASAGGTPPTFTTKDQPSAVAGASAAAPLTTPTKAAKASVPSSRGTRTTTPFELDLMR